MLLWLSLLFCDASVQQLGDNRYAVRQNAYANLETIGWMARPALQKTIAETQDLEVKDSAKRIIEQQDKNRQVYIDYAVIYALFFKKGAPFLKFPEADNIYLAKEDCDFIDRQPLEFQCRAEYLAKFLGLMKEDEASSGVVMFNNEETRYRSSFINCIRHRIRGDYSLPCCQDFGIEILPMPKVVP